MKVPKVRYGDVVCITTMHNETMDDLHFGIVHDVNHETYLSTGKLDILYMCKSFTSLGTFDYNDKLTGWNTWRLTDECIKINAVRRMFTHSNPPKEWIED